jgi:hypothetical protein
MSSSGLPESSESSRERISEEPHFDIPEAVDKGGSDVADHSEEETPLQDINHDYDKIQHTEEENQEKELDDLLQVTGMQGLKYEGIIDDQELRILDIDKEDISFERGHGDDEMDISAISDDFDNEFGVMGEYLNSDEEIPPELLEDEDYNTPVRGRNLWISGVILLIVLITSQIIWFNRDKILLHYPGFRPYFSSFCEKFGCELIRARDISNIVLLNRDVRDHPRFSDSLLVNATVENQSGRLQPYPQIRLTLFDTDGTITGYRTFKPDEYLDQSVNVQAGMPAGMPVHIVLEVAGAREAAVSFEFDFL